MINEKQAKLYCSEPLEHIEGFAEAMADTTQVWDLHHRLEIQGEFVNSLKLLKKCGMYYNRPASELIFLTPAEHRRMHNKADGRGERAAAKLTREQRSKGGAKSRGKLWWNNGTIGTMAFECPGPGWVRGQLRHSSISV